VAESGRTREQNEDFVLITRGVAGVALLAGALSGAGAGPRGLPGYDHSHRRRPLTVKSDAGDLRQVGVPSTAAVLRVAPEQRI